MVVERVLYPSQYYRVSLMMADNGQLAELPGEQSILL